ncbi:MAG TPA: Ku protein [Actinospica sp.]|jgi:DNA end-binding protein Ku|nr:Ku protein [Actinospica sp.]
MQASWSGSIVFGMVSVPVQLFKATETHAGPRFHQVHEKDGGRIRLKRYCEVEDREVPYREIAKGYETEDDEQLVLTAKDLEALPIPSKNIIDVQAFVDVDTFDPIQYESAYYVGLGKRSPGKPYALLREALREDGKVAVAKVTLTSRESLAVLRVVDDLLVLHTMLWPDEVRPARGIEPPTEKLHANELRMAQSLMEQMSEGFEVDDLHDEYREAVEALIEAKLAGGETETEPRPKAPSNVVDITELLQRSIDAQKARHGDTRADTTKAASSSKSASATAAAKKTAKTTKSAKSANSATAGNTTNRSAKAAKTAKTSEAAKTTKTAAKKTAAKKTASAKSSSSRKAG